MNFGLLSRFTRIAGALSALFVLGSKSPALCAVRLPAVFSDHMVVQADASVPVWGWAAPGEEVTVALAGQSKSTKTGADGKWKVALDPLQASDRPQTLIVKGKNTV